MPFKHHQTILSTKKCIICAKYLKQNLIEKKPNATLCYKHYRLSLNKTVKHDYPRQKHADKIILEN